MIYPIYTAEDFLDEVFMPEAEYSKLVGILKTKKNIILQGAPGVGAMLPVMQTDFMLIYKEKVLIIDAKYYTHTNQSQFDTHTLHSGNLYQIFTYVKIRKLSW